MDIRDKIIKTLGREFLPIICFYKNGFHDIIFIDKLIMTIDQLLAKKPYLNWSMKDKSKLSDDSVTFSILNYGDFDDVKLLVSEFGMKKVSDIFTNQLKKRNNYN